MVKCSVVIITIEVHGRLMNSFNALNYCALPNTSMMFCKRMHHVRLNIFTARPSRQALSLKHHNSRARGEYQQSILVADDLRPQIEYSDSTAFPCTVHLQ